MINQLSNSDPFYQTGYAMSHTYQTLITMVLTKF